MPSAFSNRLCTNGEISQSNRMADLKPELYIEVLKYKTQENNYITQPIDLASYRYVFTQRAA